MHPMCETNRNILSYHENHLSNLQDNKSKIQNLRIKLSSLRNQLKQTHDIFTRLNLDEQIYVIEENIKQMEEHTPNDYLLQVSNILRAYSKQVIPMTSTKDNNNTSATDINSYVEKKITNNRGQLFNQYLSLVTNASYTPQIIDKHDDNVCKECDSTVYITTNESSIICPNCGYIDTYFQPNSNGLTYEQEINTNLNVHFAYKRINHLRELLSQLQAKETSGIPEDVLDKIRGEFKKARIKNLSEITEIKIKSYLKKLGLNKYYENTRQITNILNGKPPPVISNELYEQFIIMFTDIQEPFERVCPKTRKNFFSYNYVLYKFCELLDEHDVKQVFPLLKSREKLYQQDCIWKDICAIMNWKFIKSV